MPPATCVLALVPASVVDGSAAAAAPATVALAAVAVVEAAAAAIVDGISATGLEDAFSEGQNAAVGRSGTVGHAVVLVSLAVVVVAQRRRSACAVRLQRPSFLPQYPAAFVLQLATQETGAQTSREGGRGCQCLNYMHDTGIGWGVDL